MFTCQYLALKHFPLSLLMGREFQEGFNSSFNCLGLRDTEPSLAQKVAPAEVSGQLMGSHRRGVCCPKGGSSCRCC